MIDNLKSVDNTMAVLSHIDHSVSILCHNGEFFKEFFFYSRDESEQSIEVPVYKSDGGQR